MLILFDIDGTLITSRSAAPRAGLCQSGEPSDGGSRDGVGVAAWLDAGRNLFGDHFSLDGVEIAGRLDYLLWRDAVRRFGLTESAEEEARFRAEYGRMLQERLDGGATVRVLRGVRELIDELATIECLTLGLLTGNYPETGRMKLEAAGFDMSVFKVGAWGCDGQSRRDLPPVAINAHRQRSGQHISPEHVIVIGDTPHDIDCAKHNGCRAIGVATGKFSVDELREVGADLAVPTLADTSHIVQWLGVTRATAAR